MRSLIAFGVGCLFGALAIWGWSAVGNHSGGAAPYAGQQQRSVSSLSSEDIAELEKGAGWGLAKPAELNGYPGPLHILELADKLDLSAAQRATIERTFAEMNGEARRLGVALIAAEKGVDALFQQANVTPQLLGERLAASESIRADLRSTHLAAHVAVTPLLSQAQKELYAELRGYAASGGHSGH